MKKRVSLRVLSLAIAVASTTSVAAPTFAQVATGGGFSGMNLAGPGTTFSSSAGANGGTTTTTTTNSVGNSGQTTSQTTTTDNNGNFTTSTQTGGAIINNNGFLSTSNPNGLNTGALNNGFANSNVNLGGTGVGGVNTSAINGFANGVANSGITNGGNAAVVTGSGFSGVSGWGYGGGGDAPVQRFMPNPSQQSVAGPMQVTRVGGSHARPVVVASREIFTNGVPTMVSAPVVTEYSWPSHTNARVYKRKAASSKRYAK